MASPDDSQTRPKAVDHQYVYNDNSNFQAQQQHHMYPQTPPVMYPIIPCPHPQAAYPYTPSSPQSSSFHHVSINYPYNNNNNNPGYYYNNNNNNSSNNYNQQPYIQGEIIRNETFSSSFGRMMLILMVVLVAAMCMMSLATWLLYGTYVPEFEVASLKVSNFTATNTTLRGTWSADVIVYNPNEELAVNFERVRSLVFYKGVVVGASTLDSFQVESNLRFNMNFSVVAADADEERVVSVGSSNNNNNNNINNLHGLVLSALAQDWSNGAVVFSLRISLDAKLASPNQVYRQDNLRVSCDDLEVKFMAADMDEGRLSRGLGAQCLIRIRDSQG